jgi:hypothetical protein
MIAKWFMLEIGMHRDRESRTLSFPLAKVFSEVSSLFGSPLDIRRSEENNRAREARYSRLFSSLSSGVPSKLLTSLNILIIAKDRAREIRARCMPSLKGLSMLMSPTNLLQTGHSEQLQLVLQTINKSCRT